MSFGAGLTYTYYTGVSLIDMYKLSPQYYNIIICPSYIRFAIVYKSIVNAQWTKLTAPTRSTVYWCVVNIIIVMFLLLWSKFPYSLPKGMSLALPEVMHQFISHACIWCRDVRCGWVLHGCLHNLCDAQTATISALCRLCSPIRLSGYSILQSTYVQLFNFTAWVHSVKASYIHTLTRYVCSVAIPVFFCEGLLTCCHCSQVYSCIYRHSEIKIFLPVETMLSYVFHTS